MINRWNKRKKLVNVLQCVLNVNYANMNYTKFLWSSMNLIKDQNQEPHKSKRHIDSCLCCSVCIYFKHPTKYLLTYLFLNLPFCSCQKKKRKKKKGSVYKTSMVKWEPPQRRSLTSKIDPQVSLSISLRVQVLPED